MKKIIILLLCIACMDVNIAGNKNKLWKLIKGKNTNLIQCTPSFGGQRIQLEYPNYFHLINYVDSPSGYLITNYYGHGGAYFYIQTDYALYINDNIYSNTLQRDSALMAQYGEIKPVSFDGKDCKGFYWREYISKGIIIGYCNVPESLKNEFDKIIDSFQKIE